MKNKVTMQEIADVLGISRNTVSKVLNNTGSVSEKTKVKVFEKAREMGYKQNFYLSDASPHAEMPRDASNEIAFFVRARLDSSHFANTLINIFQKDISKKGYRLLFFLIGDHEYEAPMLPENFQPSSCAGIICAEIFSKKYTDFLCSLNIPLLFADTYVNKSFEMIPAHVLYMEGRGSVSSVVQKLLAAGKTKIGFIGDPDHCHTFYERFLGYQEALAQADNDSAKKYAILFDDSISHTGDDKWLLKLIQALPELPDVFVCNNDFYAIEAMHALRLLHISVPDDIWIVGFDNNKESRMVMPSLTTISIPEDGLGHIAASILLNRIENPDSSPSVTYVHTEPVYRESTGNLNDKDEWRN